MGDKIANVQLIIKTYLGEGSPAGLCLRKLSVATVFSPYSDAVDELKAEDERICLQLTKGLSISL